MEMGKLTAKLRDAVLVCFMVDGVEVKRYRNIEIPDDLKKLEYHDFKLDVPVNGNITFQISFAPGVLPMEYPEERKRRTRTSKDVPVDVVGNTSGITSVEESAEETQDITNIIILQGDPVEEIQAAKAAGDEAASMVEVQASEGAMAGVISETKAQEATPAKKPAARCKKASVKGSTK